MTHSTHNENKLFEVMWRINESCNYRCEYCFRDGIDEDKLALKERSIDVSPEQIAASFERTGKIWKIHITGGEPFLKPDFVEIAARLSKKQLLSINTNLSTNNISDFWESVDPKGVHCIYASIHLAEREKRNGIEKFLNNILELQNRGFRVKIIFVAHPPQMNRIFTVRDYFFSRGVKLFSVKIFRGLYKGKSFPKSYEIKQIELLQDTMTSKYEKKILLGRMSFIGKTCLSGYSSFNMDARGNLTRCASINRSHGNLFSGTECFDKLPNICYSRFCACPYQGMKFVQEIEGDSRFHIDKFNAYRKMIVHKIKNRLVD